jgi:VWFA-related protein
MSTRRILARTTVLAIAAAAVLGSRHLAARGDSQRTQTPAFRSGTTLVEFTIVALDDHRRPITNLKKEDIAVTEMGQPRDVAFFRHDGANTDQTAETQTLPDGLYTNRPEYTPGPPLNVTAIVIDALHTRPADQVQVRSQLLRYLDALGPNTRVAVYQMGWRLLVLQNFTEDLRTVRARMSKLVADPQMDAFVDFERLALDDAATVEQLRSVSFTFAELIQEALRDGRAAEQRYVEKATDRKRAMTLASLEALGTQLAGLPGRKSIIWITTGTPIHTTYDGYVEVHEKQLRRTAQRIASQGIAIYPVDAQGLKNTELLISPTPTATGRGARGAPTNPPMPAPPTFRSLGLPDQRLWATMDVLAEVTGGRVSRNTNDLTQGVQDAASDLRGAYTVGFYSVGAPDGNWHDLKVATNRPGVRLLHRQGYISEAPKAQPMLWTDPQWQWAIANPLGSTVIHLDARIEPTAKVPAGTYDLLLLIPPDELYFRQAGDKAVADVDVVLAEKLPNGSFSYRVEPRALAVPAGTPTADAVVRYMDRWKLRPGTSTIRLIVRDKNTGSFGTLDISTKQLPNK